MVKLKEGLVARFASLVVSPAPSYIHMSSASWTRGGGMFRSSLLSGLLQGGSGTFWATAVLIWWFPGFLHSCHLWASKSTIAQWWVELLQSGSKLWHDYFKISAQDLFCCRSLAAFCHRGPHSSPRSVSLHHMSCVLYCWESGVTFPLPAGRARPVLWLWCHQGAPVRVCVIMAVTHCLSLWQSTQSWKGAA